MKGYTIFCVAIFILAAILHETEGMIVAALFIGVFASSWAKEHEAQILYERKEQQAEGYRRLNELDNERAAEIIKQNPELYGYPTDKK